MTADLLGQPGGSPSGNGADRGTPWPVSEHEAERVAALRSYGVLDQPPAEDLDAAARLAAYICGVPNGVINLLDADRQWQAAAHGFERGEVPRGDSMCQYTVLDSRVVVTPDASEDERFAYNPFVVGPIDRVRFYASAPLLTGDGYAIGTVCAYDREVANLSDEQTGLLRDLARMVMQIFEARRLAHALGRSASRDSLTGLANRRSLEQAVDSAIARAERGLGTPSVVLVDLDGFKAVNDTYGHSAGDSILRKVGNQLTATARGVDTVARLGGDEFVVLLEHTGGPGATAALGRLRACLADIGLENADGPLVRASLGMSTYRPGDSVASLISRADAEMYADKASHR